MTRSEFCQRVADYNEAIYDTEQELNRIRSQLNWGDEKHKDWYIAKEAEETAELERLNRELQEFCSQYEDVFFEK